MALRCMRKHLLAIETDGVDGRMLTFDQPSHVAGFVRALGAVATKRKKRLDDELGAMSLVEMLEKAVQIPELREALATMNGGA